MLWISRVYLGAKGVREKKSATGNLHYFWLIILTLSAQAKNPSVGAQGGGYPPTFPPLKTIFPVESMHTNYTIDRGYKTLLICEEKKIKCFTASKWRPFENFRFAS